MKLRQALAIRVTLVAERVTLPLLSYPDGIPTDIFMWVLKGSRHQC